MANTLRSVNTKFWNDTFIEELTPSEKLLFLYLLTNPLCSLLGIYEISIKRIIYDTGLNTETVRKGFERLGKDSKAFYEGNYVILPNFLKNQNLNSNMKVAVSRQFNELPEWLRTKILGNGSEWLPNGSEGFERIRNGLAMVRKVEIEVEVEVEVEVEKKKDVVSGKIELLNYSQFIEQFNTITKRSFKGTSKDKTQFTARLKDGYTIPDFEKAIKNCLKDPFHIENPNYLTPEFITRADKLERYLNYVKPNVNSEKKSSVTANPM